MDFTLHWNTHIWPHFWGAGRSSILIWVHLWFEEDISIRLLLYLLYKALSVLIEVYLSSQCLWCSCVCYHTVMRELCVSPCVCLSCVEKSLCLWADTNHTATKLYRCVIEIQMKAECSRVLINMLIYSGCGSIASLWLTCPPPPPPGLSCVFVLMSLLSWSLSNMVGAACFWNQFPAEHNSQHPVSLHVKIHRRATWSNTICLHHHSLIS